MGIEKSSDDGRREEEKTTRSAENVTGPVSSTGNKKDGANDHFDPKEYEEILVGPIGMLVFCVDGTMPKEFVTWIKGKDLSDETVIVEDPYGHDIKVAIASLRNVSNYPNIVRQLLDMGLRRDDNEEIYEGSHYES